MYVHAITLNAGFEEQSESYYSTVMIYQILVSE
jgi:hypothetical protein